MIERFQLDPHHLPIVLCTNCKLLRNPTENDLARCLGLVRPIDVSLRLSKMYWILCPKATSALPKITLFREWLLAEAADDPTRAAGS